MKKILVTGAKGMLGQDLCPILKQQGYNVLETDSSNLNIINLNLVESFIKDYKPDFVFHCAAYTNVDKAEQDASTAFLVNAQGTENIAKICADNDIPIVYVSTDYVFNGEACEPYLPTYERNPLGVYGQSKADGEIAIEKYCEKYYIVRTSWLYGHKGKNFVETIIDLSKKMPELKVVNDQFGCPTWTVDLAEFLLSLITEEKPYGIYHFCGSGKASWHEFACEALNLLGITTKVVPCKSDEFPRPAKRPSYSVMDNAGACQHWKEALRKYIELRG